MITLGCHAPKSVGERSHNSLGRSDRSDTFRSRSVAGREARRRAGAAGASDGVPLSPTLSPREPCVSVAGTTHPTKTQAGAPWPKMVRAPAAPRRCPDACSNRPASPSPPCGEACATSQVAGTCVLFPLRPSPPWPRRTRCTRERRSLMRCAALRSGGPAPAPSKTPLFIGKTQF